MANADTPRGFRLIGEGRINKYYIPPTDETAVFIGDPVSKAGGSDASGNYETVAQSAAGAAILGVVVGIDQHEGVASGSVNLDQKYRPADTGMYVYVCDDPSARFVIQDDADSATLTAADLGLNADIIVGSGDTVTGFSGVEVDTSSKNTTATLQVKILGVQNRPDNELGANADLVVQINNHQLGSHTGTAGV